MNTLARKYFPFVLIPNFLYYDKFIAEMKRKLTLSFKQKAIVTNVVWSLGGKIVNMVSALFVGILVARYLGPENYGIMNYVISYVSIFTIVATFGMSNIEIRELSRNKEKKNSILGTCFIIRVCFSLIAYLGVVLSLFVFQIDRFTTIMILVYGLTLFTGISELSRNYFRFLSVRLNRLKNKLLANYLRNRGNDLATVRNSAFCVAILSNNSFICKYNIFFRKYELSVAIL